METIDEDIFSDIELESYDEETAMIIGEIVFNLSGGDNGSNGEA